jgi:4-hydroxy-2-oxoheptanedioate aldolase
MNHHSTEYQTMSQTLRQKLNANQPALGFFLMYPICGLIECIEPDWDWVWIDGQHGQFDYRSFLECVRVADGCGIPPIVRVPGHEYGVIGPVMDMNPAGIMVPMVNNAQEARAVVKATRFPPLGERSYGGRRAIDQGGRIYHQTANDDTIVIAQIETPQAIENAEAIASIEGVDVLFFSPDDIKLRLGLPIDTAISDSDELAAAMEKVITAVKNTGTIGGCVTCTSPAITMAQSLGYTLLVGTGDVGLIRQGAAAQLATLQEALHLNSQTKPSKDQNNSSY